MLDFSKYLTVDNSYRALAWVFAFTGIWGFATLRQGWPYFLLAALVASYTARDLALTERFVSLVRMIYPGLGQPPAKKPDELPDQRGDEEPKT